MRPAPPGTHARGSRNPLGAKCTCKAPAPPQVQLARTDPSPPRAAAFAAVDGPHREDQAIESSQEGPGKRVLTGGTGKREPRGRSGPHRGNMQKSPHRGDRQKRVLTGRTRQKSPEGGVGGPTAASQPVSMSARQRGQAISSAGPTPHIRQPRLEQPSGSPVSWPARGHGTTHGHTTVPQAVAGIAQGMANSCLESVGKAKRWEGCCKEV